MIPVPAAVVSRLRFAAQVVLPFISEGLEGTTSRPTQCPRPTPRPRQRARGRHVRGKRPRPNKQEESCHDADSNPALSVPEDDETTEDELESGLTYIVRASHEADEVLTVSGIMQKNSANSLPSKAQTKSSSTPHQMRVGNIHGPQTGVDVTEIPTERQRAGGRHDRGQYPRHHRARRQQPQPLLRRRATRSQAGSIGRRHSASNPQRRRLVGCKWNRVVDPQTEQDLLKTSKNVAQHHEGRWAKLNCNGNAAIPTKQKGYPKRGRPAEIWEYDINSYP